MAKVTKNFTFSKGGGQIGAAQRGETPAEVAPVIEPPVETVGPQEIPAETTEGEPAEVQEKGTDKS